MIDTSVSDKRRYNIIENEDGTKSLEDVTTYSQIGSNFGAEQVNQTNGAVNSLINGFSEIEMYGVTVLHNSVNFSLVKFGVRKNSLNFWTSFPNL